MSKFLSLSDRKSILTSFVIGVAIASFGTVFSILLGVSTFFPVGIATLTFFFRIFVKDPLLFLLLIIPFRMALDFFGDAVTIGGSFGSFSLSQTIGVFMFTIGITFFLRRGRFLESVREFFPFLILLAWGTLSLFVSVNVSETAKDILRVFDIFVLASMSFVLTRSRNDARRILLSILLSSVIPLAFGVWQFATGDGYPEEFVRIERIYGTFGHPNVFGMYLFSIVVSAIVFLRVFSEKTKEKLLASGILLACLVALLPTLARVAWVITFVFFALLAVFRFRKWILPLMLIPAMLVIFVGPVRNRVSDALTPSADSSVLWRMNIWNDAYGQTVSSGRVFLGFGLNTFSTLISGLHSEEFGSAEAHNDFVKFFVEGGIIGLSIYLFWLGWFALRLFRISHDSGSESRLREFSFLLLLFLVSLALASFSDAVFKSTPIQWIFWILVGVALGMERNRRNIQAV